MNRVKDKVAVVTGAARGIGAAIAARLAEEGALVIITDVLSELGEETAGRIRQHGYQAVFKQLDVGDELRWNGVFDEIASEFKRLDILVNNAGIDIAKTIEDATVDDFNKIMKINLIGPFLGMRGAIKLMKENGGGSIVNVCSLSTRIVAPTSTLYAPSKSALGSLTKTAAVHCGLSDYNIRVNSIHPGFTATEMTMGGNNPVFENPIMKAMIEAIPLKRVAQPEEMANIVLFLASEESSYMTGSEIVPDGGKLLM